MNLSYWKIGGIYIIASTTAGIMIVDSGAFYDQFSSVQGMGYLQACLLEFALAITTGVSLHDDRFGFKNFLVKLLMICLFALSIATATLQVALDEIEIFSQLLNQNKAMALIQSGIKESAGSREWLKTTVKR